MTDLKTLWNWLITSSEDPQKTSLAVKGVLVLGADYLLKAVAIACAVGYACLPIDSASAQPIIDAITTLIQAGLMAIGVGAFFYGLYRKIRNGQWTAAQ